MRLKIRMLGFLQKIKGIEETFIDIPENSTVESAIQKILNDDVSLKEKIWDDHVNSPSPNTLIMLDGVEINNLLGIETQIKPNQELVILSVVHGG